MGESKSIYKFEGLQVSKAFSKLLVRYPWFPMLPNVPNVKNSKKPIGFQVCNHWDEHPRFQYGSETLPQATWLDWVLCTWSWHESSLVSLHVPSGTSRIAAPCFPAPNSGRCWRWRSKNNIWQTVAFAGTPVEVTAQSRFATARSQDQLRLNVTRHFLQIQTVNSKENEKRPSSGVVHWGSQPLPAHLSRIVPYSRLKDWFPELASRMFLINSERSHKIIPA